MCVPAARLVFATFVAYVDTGWERSSGLRPGVREVLCRPLVVQARVEGLNPQVVLMMNVHRPCHSI